MRLCWSTWNSSYTKVFSSKPSAFYVISIKWARVSVRWLQFCKNNKPDLPPLPDATTQDDGVLILGCLLCIVTLGRHFFLVPAKHHHRIPMQITKRARSQLEQHSVLGIIRSKSIVWGITHTYTSKRSKHWEAVMQVKSQSPDWTTIHSVSVKKLQSRASVKNRRDRWSTYNPYTGNITLQER